MKLVHAADLHLDSPLHGLVRYEGAPVERIRGSTRRALQNLVSLCLEQDARLLLIAGDLYDGTWRDHSTALFFTEQMARLRAVDCRVVWVRGNHDAQSRLTGHLRPGSHVLELPHDRPGTERFEELGVAVHGQGFSRADLTDDLLAAYPVPVGDLLNIGLLHTALTGRAGHALYAPCSLERLVAQGYDYWALGHVHQREELCREPWVVFPGNLQGRHARETGPKGATVITVDGGRITEVRPVALDVMRWERAEVDVTLAKNLDDVLDAVSGRLDELSLRADGRLCAVRVVLAGRSPMHTGLLREQSGLDLGVRELAHGVGELWIEKVKLATEPPRDLDALAERDDAVGGVLAALHRLREEPRALSEFAELVAPMTAKLPPELRGLVLPSEPGALAELSRDVEQIVLSELLEGDGA